MPQRNARTVVRLRARALSNALRESLLFLPAAFLLCAIGLAEVLARADERLEPTSLPLSLRVSPDAAISLLSTIAGATITTAGVVFSILVVSLQLASGQFSPRVLRGFFRDRLGQVVVGLLVATFAYCMLALRAVKPGDNGSSAAPELSVDVAVLLALSAVFAIVGYLNRISRSQYVGRIAERISYETIDLVDHLHRHPAHRSPAVEEPDVAALGEPHVVAADADGWVQQVSSDGLLGAVPAGSVVRLETRVGAYVVRGMPLASVWPPPPRPDRVDDELVDAVVVGGARTMQQDVDFGLRQLNDIALRALSPAVNDPTTAIEVVVRVASIMRRLVTADLPPQVRRDDRGTVLLRPWDLDHDEYVAHAYDQIRHFAAGHAAVCAAIVRSLRMLAEAARDSGHPERVPALERQVELTIVGVERAGLLPEDVDAVRRAALPREPADPAPALQPPMVR